MNNTVLENVNSVNDNEEVYNEIEEKLMQLSDEARQEVHELMLWNEICEPTNEEFRAELERRIALLEESQAS